MEGTEEFGGGEGWYNKNKNWKGYKKRHDGYNSVQIELPEPFA